MKKKYNYLASSQEANPMQKIEVSQLCIESRLKKGINPIRFLLLIALVHFTVNYSYSSNVFLDSIYSNYTVEKIEDSSTKLLSGKEVLELSSNEFRKSEIGTEKPTLLQLMPTWFRDADVDGYGNPLISIQAATAPAGYVGNSSDCDDSNPLVWRLGTFYIDIDGDGYNNGSTILCYGANVPTGYSRGTIGRDCDDNNANVYRSGVLFVDSDNDGYTDGLQEVCYGASVPAGYSMTSLGVDCNDSDGSIFQSATVFIDQDLDGFHGLSIDNYCYGAVLPEYYFTGTMGFDCDDTNAAINPDAIEIPNNGVDENCNGMQDDSLTAITTIIRPSQCGSVLPHIYSSIFAVTGIPNVTMYTFEIINPNNIVQTISTTNGYFQLTSLANFAYNTVYFVRVGLHISGVWQGYGAACSVSTPSLDNVLTLVQCGATVNIYSPINAAVVSGATGYKFRVTNLSNPGGPNGVMETEQIQPWFFLTSLPSYEYGTTYSVQVAIKTTGAYSDFGPACEITTRSVASFPLTIKQCGVLYTNIYSPINATIIPNVSGYKFRVTNLSTLISQEIIPAHSWINLNQLTMYTANTNYSVEVAVKTSGDFGAYGPACTITSPPAAAAAANKNMAPTDVKIRAYPNPFTEIFSLDITRGGEGAVEVRVYDMIGKLLEVHSVQAGDLSSLALGNRFPAGVYNVIATHGGNVHTLRVIKR